MYKTSQLYDVYFKFDIILYWYLLIYIVLYKYSTLVTFDVVNVTLLHVFMYCSVPFVVHGVGYLPNYIIPEVDSM